MTALSLLRQVCSNKAAPRRQTFTLNGQITFTKGHRAWDTTTLQQMSFQSALDRQSVAVVFDAEGLTTETDALRKIRKQ